jgi:methionyl-tRNA formyltransferase
MKSNFLGPFRRFAMHETIIFIGSKALGKAAAEAINSVAPANLKSVITYDDTSDARSALRGFEEFSRDNDIPLHKLKSNSELPALIKDLRPDVCVVVGWYWILKKAMLDNVSGGVVGIHASLLPKYRGHAPLVWALLNGEKQSGISLFYFDEGMDTGDIIAQERFSIGQDETIADLLSKVTTLTKRILRTNIPLILAGNAARTAQDHSMASYCSQRMAEDGLIQWSATNTHIYNAIRSRQK